MAQSLSPHFLISNHMSTGLKYLFSKEHTWAAQSNDGTWLVGISEYAQNMLGDVVFIDPPKVGQSVEQFAICGLIESVKTGSDIYAPLTGTVLEVNEEALSSPEQVNDYPYATWIFKLEANASGADALLDKAAYEAQVE